MRCKFYKENSLKEDMKFRQRQILVEIEEGVSILWAVRDGNLSTINLYSPNLIFPPLNFYEIFYESLFN